MTNEVVSTRGERVSVRPEIGCWFEKEPPEQPEPPAPAQPGPQVPVTVAPEEIKPAASASASANLPARQRVTKVSMVRDGEGYTLIASTNDGNQHEFYCRDAASLELPALRHAVPGLIWNTSTESWRDYVLPYMKNFADAGKRGLWVFHSRAERRARQSTVSTAMAEAFRRVA
jgi:hypothetical protein